MISYFGVTRIWEDGDGLHSFELAPVGPHTPPPLGCWVEWRPESPRPWFAYFADATLEGMYSTQGEAQQAISRGDVKGAINE